MSGFQSVTAQSLEIGGNLGGMLNVDRDFKAVHKSVTSFAMAYRHFTSSSHDSAGFARAFGYPSFSYGWAWINFNGVRVRSKISHAHYDSRMGSSLVLYAGFHRPLLHITPHLDLEYNLQHGLSYNTHPWQRNGNVENELVGTRWTAYVQIGCNLSYHHGPLYLKLGPELRHLSNATLGRPNKGANWWDISLTAGYHLSGKVADRVEKIECMTDSVSDSATLNDIKPCKLRYRPLLVEVTLRGGVKTSLGQWQVKRKDIRYGLPLHYRHMSYYCYPQLSTALLWRYHLKFASGIGIDAFYEPYINSIESQNPAPYRSISPWSVGISAQHRIYYRRLTVHMGIGCYISRDFKRWAHTEEESAVYERIGLAYTLPIFGNHLSMGYNVMAHRTKAYSLEMGLFYQFPIKRGHK